MISTWQFHERTKHRREAMDGHPLNWSCKPEAFKTYPQRACLSTVAMPEPAPIPERSLSAILNNPMSNSSGLDMNALSQLLHLTSALTGQTRQGKEVFHFRSAPSAGALYPCEIYLALGPDARGPGPGLYHYNLPDRSLVRLCEGDALGKAKSLAGMDENLAGMMLFTGIFYRSSWKYRHRAYRYILLDTGHLLENLYLACRAQGMSVEFQYDFDDQGISELLGIDPRREACLAVAGLPGGESSSRGDCPAPMTREDLARSSRCSIRETEYPLLLDFHESTTTVVESGEGLWSSLLENLGLPEGKPFPFPAVGHEEQSYPDCLMHRRSRRNFVTATLEGKRAGTFLKLLTGTHAPDKVKDFAATCFLAQNVTGLNNGLYFLDREAGEIRSLGKGPSHKAMAQACLDQMWLSQAHFLFFRLANLQLIDERAGSRGYRYAMLESGRFGQRVYLAATAMNMGACGIGAYYDQEASDLLRLHNRASLLYLLAAGGIRKS